MGCTERQEELAVTPTAPPYEHERALTIAEFCAIERMSLATYHKLKRGGRGPDEVRFPGMTFIRITAQARREWHARIEQWRQEQAAQLEQRRRTELATAAGRRAAQSPRHISKQRRRGEA
jgi:hypothetical protein